jgi:tricorn protease interacting factor F2/3
VVLSDIISSLNFFHTLLSKEKFWDEIKEYNRRFFSKIFTKLGWDPIEGEKPTNPLLRSQLITALGRLENDEIREEAKSRFVHFLKSGKLNPDLRGPVYSTVAWNGD